MKWFQVDSDTPDDPKIKAVIRRGLPSPNPGQAAAGALLLLWCYVANHGGGAPGIGVDSDGQPLPLGEMADELLFDSQADLERFLDFLAEKRAIDPAAWADQRMVMLPAMAKRADAYARSKGRPAPAPKPPAPAPKPPGRAKSGEKSPGSALTVPTVPTVQHQETEEGQLALTPALPAGPTPEDLVQVWNRHRLQGPKVQQLTDVRRRAYAAALKAAPDLRVWEAVIRWVETQPWCNAKGTGDHANWRLDLDHLAKPGKLQTAKERMDGDRNGAGRSAAASGRVAATQGKYAGAGHDD
ncbi:MAG: hypothetical protein AB7P11_21165 [Hydrogenophaga sp.]|uniref:hypothetical protein n=1 Tax=Hydrogenophaga sp. TaxID=1904254 RepID=UPI003D11D1D7